MTPLVKSKYPIICAPMNRVSDLTLALAAFNAGIVPSLVIYNYRDTEWDSDFSKFKTELTEFIRLTGSTQLVVALKSELLLKKKSVIELLLKTRPACVEIFDVVDTDSRELLSVFSLFNKVGIKLVLKILGVKDIGIMEQYVSGIIIKGQDGAARIGTLPIALTDRIIEIKKKYPTKYIIASGGIESSADIRDCLDAGANAVSLGTVFAMTCESSISKETKDKILTSSFSEIKNIGTERQNALVFSSEPDIDGNHTMGLELGVKSPVQGHVFVGKAIDSITEVEPLSAVVKKLVDGL